MIKEQINALRREAEAIRENLGAKLQQIRDLEDNCQHEWSEPKRIYGDRPEIHSSRKWERTCSFCGKVDVTYREALMSVPDFGNNDGKVTFSLPH